MAMKEVLVVPAYVAGTVIGEHNLGVHIENDATLNGVAKRRRTVDYYPSSDVPGVGGTFWAGRHIYRASTAPAATIFHYDLTATAGAAANLDVDGYYNAGGGALEIHFLDATVLAGNTDDLSGTQDLTAVALTDGKLYPITITYSTIDRTGASITVMQMYSVYTGPLTYTAPHAIVDTDASATTEWNAWRANDGYFDQMMPHFTPACEIQAVANPIWTGWIPERFGRIYYKVTTDLDVIGHQVEIIYGAGTLNETTETLTATSTDPETWEDTFDVVYGAYAEGTLREVRVRLTAGSSGTVNVHYIRNAPNGTEAPATSFHSIDVGHGDIIYGNTTANRLSYLNDNDAHLNAVFAIEGRQDFACTSTNATQYDLDSFSFIRLGDTLYYNTKNVTMTWGTSGTYTLTDNDDGLPAVGYHTLDLRSVTNLDYGMVYTIAVVDGTSELNFAEEVA